jgi:hypothetical protein
MLVVAHRSYSLAFLLSKLRRGIMACCWAAALPLVVSAGAQQPATPQEPEANQQSAPSSAQSNNSEKPSVPAEQRPTPPPVTPTPAAPVPAPPAATEASQAPRAAKKTKAAEPIKEAGTNEGELKRLLVGKALYLRGGYLDNSIRFDEYGRIIGHSSQGSYTLCAIEIDKVHLMKHKVELTGVRFGLHFIGQLASEDSSTAFDRVRITPKKKVVSITIDREIVIKPKKQKETKTEKQKGKKSVKAEAAAPADEQEKTAADRTAATAPESAATTPSQPETETSELSEADQLKASIAATPEAERPAAPSSVTTTTSPAHAAKLLKDALDKIFAQGLDDRMMAEMPDFWKLYYKAVTAKTDYRPQDPAILRQNTVDQKALLITKFEPDSNEFAQANGVAGMALYHTVVGPDGKAGEIAVGRPIGFGLDENAVEAIHKASFQAAVKDGKPVPVLLDLVVQFRIFSSRTNIHTEPEPAGKPAEPILPGPYSVPR